jgi:PqqD family protein of HPr-rel-A system
MMGTDKCPHPTGTTAGKDLGDEYMFYDREQDRVHVLNGTAREIFLLCDGKRTIEEVVRALAERYGIEEARARRDTEQTLEELMGLGLLAAD